MVSKWFDMPLHYHTYHSIENFNHERIIRKEVSQIESEHLQQNDQYTRNDESEILRCFEGAIGFTWVPGAQVTACPNRYSLCDRVRHLPDCTRQSQSDSVDCLRDLPKIRSTKA